MTGILLLLDVAGPSGGPLIAGAVVGFFLFLAAVALVAFLLLRKTLKMVFRMAIVAVILMIALVGSIAIWWLGSGPSPRPRPNRPIPSSQR